MALGIPLGLLLLLVGLAARNAAGIVVAEIASVALVGIADVNAPPVGRSMTALIGRLTATVAPPPRTPRR